MPYEISSLQKNAAPDEAVQSRGYILIEHMGLDKFGKLVRDIRITYNYIPRAVRNQPYQRRTY